MKLSDVKIGQKVKALIDEPKGLTGMVRTVNADKSDDSYAVGIEFPKFNGHSLRGMLPEGNDNGWFLPADGIELVPDAPSSSAGDTIFPSDAKSRKEIPVASGVLDYFPAALAEVAKVSFAGNQQHNPDQPLHWARGKSGDQADTMIRHFLERGTLDSDGIRHSAKMVWRALAILQLELEAEGAPLARGAKVE